MMSNPPRRQRRLAAAIVLLTLAAGCDHGWPGIETTPTVQTGVQMVPLMEFELPLHFARRRPPVAGRPVVVFATGDGGWRGADRDMFEAIVTLGYATAGFSAKEYLEHLDHLPDTATPEHVGLDYATIVDHARQALDAPDSTSVVLAGFSRGASLAVVAAGDARLQPSLRGVLAIGLGDIEEHLRTPAGRAPSAIHLDVVRPYDYLKDLGPLTISVIQSTTDRFLGAARARELFGPDTVQRRLHPIEARSHTFDGAHDALVREIEASLTWIDTAFPAPATPLGGRQR